MILIEVYKRKLLYLFFYCLAFYYNLYYLGYGSIPYCLLFAKDKCCYLAFCKEAFQNL